MTKIIADYLVKNTFVISMNEERTCFERGAIAIHGKRIVLVGDEVDVLPKVRAAKVIDAGGAVTHPGFVDAHVHFMNTARGAFSDVLDTSTMMNTNFEVRNAKTIKIQANKKISFELLYDKNNSLHKKIKIEQTRKETSNN